MKLTFENGLYIENWFVDNVSLDGGGIAQYKDFLDFFENQNKEYNRALEWCSGLGAIGFSLLDAKIVKHITFMDIYKPAIHYVKDMASLNNINHKFFAFCAGRIQDLPDNQKFDLIVGNPPHMMRETTIEEAHEIDRKNGVNLRPKWFVDNDNRLLSDVDWKIHEEFFTNIGKYCNVGCDILISDVGGYVSINTELAKRSNLKFKQSIPAPNLAKTSSTQSCIHWFTYN